ncbi:MAG: LamG domain-containing protein [Magnetococcales bacterium]|nr:LamG domain-containing protein [Magnetococcales bacterium]
MIFHNLVRATAGGIVAADPWTVLLIHGDGNIVDASPFARALTQINGAASSPTAPKFGSGSMFFDGDACVQLNGSTDFQFGTGHFTIDFWVKLGSTGANYQDFLQFAHYSIMIRSSSGKINLLLSFDGSSWGFNGLSSSAVFTANIWHHVALVRNGTAIVAYVDGVPSITTTTSNAIYFDITRKITIGGETNLDGVTPLTNYLQNGYIDELRISKGIARWTADFSNALPTAPYG